MSQAASTVTAISNGDLYASPAYDPAKKTGFEITLPVIVLSALVLGTVVLLAKKK